MRPARPIGLVLTVTLVAALVEPAAAHPRLTGTDARWQTSPASLDPPPRPNIVMFYLDDLAPHDGRLWKDPDRTPAIYEHFVAHGVEFTNAIGESPLCCPGRGNLLTGLHTHNNGVIENNGRQFSPVVHVGSAMQEAGYQTLFMGKYLNFVERFTEAEWAQHVNGWDHIEATRSYQDTVRTKNGWVTYPGEHPTSFIGDRTAELIRETHADDPIFALVAPHNPHSPNIPVPVPQEQLDKCASIPPWKPANYNEADVSDKPAYVRKMPLLSQADGYDLRSHCESMFGVDLMVGEVIDALAAEGRLDNTLLVFGADNGMTWGAHRLPLKSNPYSTPVPLYMSWPSRWGTGGRTIGELVSSIDIAPTFCDYAGCPLGPFATGQAGADGISLAAVLDGTAASTGRDALLERLARGNSTSPAWAALRTTAVNPLGSWHYVEYITGEIELYDLAADRDEMDNLAYRGSHAAVVQSLAARLDGLLAEGRVERPDAYLTVAGQPDIPTGYNVFDDVSTQRQTLERKVTTRGSYAFLATVDNNASEADSYFVRAALTGSTRIGVRFLRNGVDITNAVVGDGYLISGLARDAWRNLRVELTVPRRTPVGSIRQVALTVSSQSRPQRKDVVVVILRRVAP